MAFAAPHPHIVVMTTQEITPETAFRIFLQDDQSYAIEVTIPDSFPTIITRFDTEAAAEKWIAGYHARLEAKPARKSWGRR